MTGKKQEKPVNPFLYPALEANAAGLRAYFNMLAAAGRSQAALLNMIGGMGFSPAACKDMAQNFSATSDFFSQLTKAHPKPDWRVDGVTIEAVEKKDFGTLLHFRRETQRNDPKILIVAPMSGHYATQLRDMVSGLLPHHDVYVVDWENARDVPLSAGDFSFDDYVRYVEGFIKKIGPDVHVAGISQSTVPLLAAVARLAEAGDAAQPLSMTLMCGPVDTRISATKVDRYAQDKPQGWLEENVISVVPAGYKGAGRKVYPGFLQLMSLMAVNPNTHANMQAALLKGLVEKDKKTSVPLADFYDEYFSVCDLADTFFLEMVEKVFVKHELAKGQMDVSGKRVHPAAIGKTVLFTVEGAVDEITAPGQTAAAHKLCTSIPSDKRYHHVQAGAGHYDLFNGIVWRQDILPRFAAMIRQAAAAQGVIYDAAPYASLPQRWKKPDSQPPANGI